MILLAKYTIILFGFFLISVGFLMLLNPKKALQILRKAGSTNFINYAEITFRMIPAFAMLFYAEFSKFPKAFLIIGGFMIITSLVLYFVPRKIHHNYALKCAEVLKPIYIQLLAPLSVFFGIIVMYTVI